MRAPESVLKVALTVIAAVLAGLLYFTFSGDKWSGYHWNDYLQQQACIPAKVGDKGNRLELTGTGETAPYIHSLTVWSCTDGRTVAIYEGLPEAAPAKLVYKDALRYRHGFLASDDAHRFVTPKDLAGLKTILDWDALVNARPL